MSANDKDVIRNDEFLHFYRLRKSKDPVYYEFKPWDRASRLIIDYLLSLQNWKPNFFSISGSDWEFIPHEDMDEAPKFFCSWGVLVSGASFSSFRFFSLSLLVTMIDGSLVPLFAVSQRPCLKKRHQHRVEKVKEYLESIKDFDELVSPQNLSLHFLGQEQSTKVWKSLEIVKRSACFCLLHYFLLSVFFLSFFF